MDNPFDLPDMPIVAIDTDDVAIITPQGRMWVDAEAFAEALHLMSHMGGDDTPNFEGLHEMALMAHMMVQAGVSDGQRGLLEYQMSLPSPGE